jgi:hypothetical protein
MMMQHELSNFKLSCLFIVTICAAVLSLIKFVDCLLLVEREAFSCSLSLEYIATRGRDKEDL